ncbi:MAG: response regulator [Bacteroidota bacterium]
MKQLNCILLVEDNYATNILHKRILENLDATRHIQIAENGEEAIEYLENAVHANGEKCPNPELIFLDINMPRMNGWEFLEEYRKRQLSNQQRVIIIMLTTSPNPDDEAKASTNPDIAGYVRKPLLPRAVKELMNKYFGDGEN